MAPALSLRSSRRVHRGVVPLAAGVLVLFSTKPLPSGSLPPVAQFLEPDTPLPPMEHTGGCKASQYHPTIGAVICQRILEGETVRQVTADPGMPSYVTLFHWLKRHEDFAEMYRVVRNDLALRQATRRAAETAHGRRVRAHRRAVAGQPPRDWVSGKASTYRRDWAARFCARIADGESGYRVSADPAMPSARCVYRWLKDIPEFREMYVTARALQREGLEWQIYLAVDAVDLTGLPRAKARVAWLEGRIGRLRPKVWRRVPK